MPHFNTLHLKFHSDRECALYEDQPTCKYLPKIIKNVFGLITSKILILTDYVVIFVANFDCHDCIYPLNGYAFSIKVEQKKQPNKIN